MSSLYVRQKVRAWAKVLTHSQYVSTINFDEDISPIDVALVIDFSADGVQVETYCRDEVETGQITMSWVGRPGIGDESLISAAEADAALFFQNSDYKLTLVSRGAPETYDTAGQSPRFICDIVFDYEFRP